MKTMSRKGRKSMKLAGLVAVLSAVGILLASALPSSAGQNCREKLNDQTFCCQWASAEGSSFETFVFSGTENPAFTLDAFSTTLSWHGEQSGV
jgi:hypothetical protein